MTEEKELTGYPSIDKPWRKFYAEDLDFQNLVSPTCCIYEFLKSCNKDKLDYIALNYYGAKITYEKLFENIDKVAAALTSYGIRKGDIVTLVALNIPEFIYLLYAINKIGAVSNWVGLTSSIEDLHKQLTDTESRFVFSVSVAHETIAKAAEGSKVESIVCIPVENSMPVFMKAALSVKNSHHTCSGIPWKAFLKSANTAFDACSVSAEDVAIIAYTGGSTGTPKGVLLSNYALNSNYVSFYKTNEYGFFSFQRGDKILSGVPIFLVFGMCACCHSPLCHSMQLVLAPDPSPQAMTDRFLKAKANHMMCGHIHIDELIRKADEKSADLSFVRMIMYGGEETNKSWEKQVMASLKKHNLSALLANSYGMSETAAGVLTAPDNDTDGLIPCVDVNIKIVNPEDEHVEYGYGEEGELCISTPQLMSGYYKHEAETNEVFFEENGTWWLKTHDLATISTDGVIKITGRIKRIYFRLCDRVTVRVYPMRIEETIIKNDMVHNCAVVGVKDEVIAYRSIAYIILADKSIHTDEAKEQLEKYCSAMLPDSHRPDEYIFVDKFPLTRAGKVDYRALEEQAKMQ